jgi:serine/threonine protein kinase
MMKWLKKGFTFLAWFMVSYGVILALSPLVQRFAPGSGLFAFFLYALIGLALSAIIPLVNTWIKDLIKSKVKVEGSAANFEEEVQKHGISGLESLGQIGPYEVLGLLERGPWWTSFIARKPGSLTSFSLTLPRSDKRKDQSAWRLIQRESTILSRLRTVKGTPDLSKKGQFEDGCPYFLLRPNQCRPLREILYELEAPQIIAGFGSLLRITSKVHSTGTIHRTIHLDNIVIDSFGRIQLRGFAYAINRDERGTLSTERCSLETQAPEQLQKGAVVDQRTDIYALGAVFYQLLTGQCAHGSEPNRDEIQAGLLTDEFCERTLIEIERSNPGLVLEAVAKLADICLRCMAFNPADRYPNAEQILKDLSFFEVGVDMLDGYVGSTGMAGSMTSSGLDTPTMAAGANSPMVQPAKESVTLAQVLASQQSSGPIPEESQTMDLGTAIRKVQAAKTPAKEELPMLFGESLENPRQLAPPPPKDQESIATLFGKSLEEDRR